jgi:predicted nucleotidyltransferase
MELVKNIVRVGNSAGILVPKQYLGGSAKILILEKPLDIAKDSLKILNPYLDSILGIYLVGSYARGEEKKNSDVDILVITSEITKRILNGKYNILLFSYEDMESMQNKNILPIYPMLLEAKTILNKRLLADMLKIKVNKNAFKFHIETTESSLKIIENLLDVSKKNYVGVNVIYPLILRLRQLFIVDCMLKKRPYKNKDFVDLLGKITKNKLKEPVVYEIYRLEKNKISKGRNINNPSIFEVRKILDFAKKMLKKQKFEILKYTVK